MILNKIQFQIKMCRFYIISKTKFAYLFNDILCIHVWKYFLDYYYNYHYYILILINWNFLKTLFYSTIMYVKLYLSSYWNLLSIATYSSKKRVGTWPDRYHLKREAISITISERIGTRVVIEYGLSAQKWKLLQEPCTV